MGTFHHPINVVSAAGDSAQEVQALVDTGALYLWLPASLLDSLGYQPSTTWEFIVATGQRVRRGLGPVVVRMNGESWAVPCVFGDEGSIPLLGAVVLETFRLAVDPVHRKLVPVPALAMGNS